MLSKEQKQIVDNLVNPSIEDVKEIFSRKDIDKKKELENVKETVDQLYRQSIKEIQKLFEKEVFDYISDKFGYKDIEKQLS